MTIAVAGGRGQLGRALIGRAAVRGLALVSADLPELDVCDAAAIARWLDAVRPSLAINAAAYTAVDRAETESERAFAVNADGASRLAAACRERAVPLLHVSTDYVFDGAATRPYREDDAVAPLGVYGASKAAGERAVVERGGCVVRTSWLFGDGGPSFVHTMLRLARECDVLRVVDDQRGCPTCADDLADALLELAARERVASIYHYCNVGDTTWYGLACVVVDEARRHRALACTRVDAITTAEYPTPAPRPAYSVLDTTRVRALGIATPSWRIGLARVIERELAR